MSESSFQFEEGLQLGDYVLRELIARYDDRELWSGEQTSVKREVEVVCYHGADSPGFLADVRVKAMVEDGTLGLVYEAVEFEGFTAFVREVLPASTLADKLQRSAKMSPHEMTRIISQIATALDILAKKGIAREVLTPSDVHLSPQGRVRLRNVACAGEPSGDEETRFQLTGAFRQMLEVGQPGATRMGTLLDYIEGSELKSPITWAEVANLSNQVDEQLSASGLPVLRSKPMVSNQGLGPAVMLAGLAVAVVMAAVGIWAINLENEEIALDLTVAVPAGRYPRPNGGLVELQGFRIDADEVTIGEYAEFLAAWNELPEKERKALFPAGVPEDKRTPRPLRWVEFYTAARGKQDLDGRKISLECPVVGVDWWDAMAYARWKGGKLPTEQEWWSAATASGASKDEPVAWGPTVGQQGKVSGLAGNVAEWCVNSSKNPSFPMKPTQPVALGASFSNSLKGALKREWIESRSLRRDDLGFRLVYPVEQ